MKKQRESKKKITDDEEDFIKSNCNTPIMIACHQGHADVVKNLLEKGSDINCKRGNEYIIASPLMVAAEQGHLEVVKVLLNARINRSNLDDCIEEALVLAEEKGFKEIEQLLVEAFKIPTAEVELIKAITEGLDSGQIHINSIDPIEGMSLLMGAVSNNQKHLAKWLIEKGINVDAQEGKYGLTALMVALQQDNIEIVKLLLDAKANINIQINGLRITALIGAVLKGNIEMVKLLIAHKPDLHIIDGKGNTALMLAGLLRKVGIAVLLREAEEQNNTEGKDEGI